MKKKNDERPEKRRNGFWQGLYLGVFTTLVLATAFVYLTLSTQGFRITLDPDRPAFMVRNQIKTEAFSVLSLLLEKIKVELPVAIEQAFLDPEWRFIAYEEGGVSLPREISEVTKDQFQKLTEKAVLLFLQGVELTPYIEELGQAALVEVKEAFKREIAGKTYHYQVNPMLSVPVTVLAR